MNARLTFILFNLALLPLYPLLAAYTLWRRFIQKKSAASLSGQWGSVPSGVREAVKTADASTPVIWMHAVSVGEQVAARPIARALKDAIPGCKIALSVTTDTGFQTAQAAIQSGDADAVFYFPLDLPFGVSRALRAIQPDVFLAVETELWPTFLHMARARGVLCLLVNGRVSDNLLQRATKTKWLWRWLISNVDAALMRSQFDADRMQQIVNSANLPEATNRVLVIGDVKLDGASALDDGRELRMKWRMVLGLDASELLVVFGSTHPGEEEIALRAFKKLRADFPELKLLIAPRHIERTNEVQALISAEGFSARRRSEVLSSNDEIFLLDTVGELSEIYAAADVAFVGGSLIPRGGHNVLEPILRGVPVLFGPHMANFRSHAELVQAAAMGDCVTSEEELVEKVASWLRDEKRRRDLPQHAVSTLAPHQGAPRRIAEYVAKQLKSKS